MCQSQSDQQTLWVCCLGHPVCTPLVASLPPLDPSPIKNPARHEWAGFLSFLRPGKNPPILLASAAGRGVVLLSKSPIPARFLLNSSPFSPQISLKSHAYVITFPGFCYANIALSSVQIQPFSPEKLVCLMSFNSRISVRNLRTYSMKLC